MPLSNKRIAGLPNTHPVCLQTQCSVLPGSPPLELCQATALHQTHTRRDTRHSAVPTSSLWTHTMPEYPPLSRATESTTTTRIPATSPCWTPAWSQTARWDTSPLPRAHHPSGPNVEQLDPCSSDSPHSSGPAGLQLQLHVE
jgi:hypothetical protein